MWRMSKNVSLTDLLWAKPGCVRNLGTPLRGSRQQTACYTGTAAVCPRQQAAGWEKAASGSPVTLATAAEDPWLSSYSNKYSGGQYGQVWIFFLEWIRTSYMSLPYTFPFISSVLSLAYSNLEKAIPHLPKEGQSSQPLSSFFYWINAQSQHLSLLMRCSFSRLDSGGGLSVFQKMLTIPR